jgi:hypothetical protein
MRNELLRFFAISGLAVTTACSSPVQETQPKPFFTSLITPNEENPYQVTANDLAQIEAVRVLCEGYAFSPIDDKSVLITTRKKHCWDFLVTVEPSRGRNILARQITGDE